MIARPLASAIALSLILIHGAMAQAPAVDPVFAKARTAVKQLLKDGPSARFEGLAKRPGAVCGFVNAKNAMGGYSGRTAFVYVASEGRAYILEAGGDDAMDALRHAEANCRTVPGF